jgi:hypothetical protein
MEAKSSNRKVTQMERQSDGCGSSKVLVLDWPNLEARMIEFLGRRPQSHERPSLDALTEWFMSRLGPDERGEAVVFANAPDPMTDGFCRWAHRLRMRGYGLYAKPRREATDIDVDLLEFVREHLDAGNIAEVILVSSDLYRDHAISGTDPLVAFARSTQVTVVGFAEKVRRYASAHPELTFLDPSEIPGLLAEEVAARRTHIAALPAEGILFAPLAPMAGRARMELVTAA